MSSRGASRALLNFSPTPTLRQTFTLHTHIIARLCRPNEPATSKTTTPPTVAFKRRGAPSQANFRQRPASSRASTARDSSNDDESSDDGSDALKGLRTKRKRQGIVSASTTGSKTPSKDHGPTVFQANRDLPISETNDATKRVDWYDQPATKGPSRTASNVRITTTTDFARDVCKDYKKTGWCGFGDSCVFVHDRSDVKQGWQLDREWETVTKKQRGLGDKAGAAVGDDKGDRDEDDLQLEGIPVACSICEGSFKMPVVTRCGHYFCEACALRRYRKDPTCGSCGTPTLGVFNAASKLSRLIDRKRERANET